MANPELKQWFEDACENMALLLKGLITFIIKAFVVLSAIITIFVMCVEFMSVVELDPVRDFDNILYWFVYLPTVICIPYYFFLKHICESVKYMGMDKEDRSFYWGVFRYFIVLPIIMILLLKIVSMLVSPSSFPIWSHFGPIWDGITLEHYQPIWAQYVNECYESTQILLEYISHITGIKWLSFLPPLESLQ